MAPKIAPVKVKAPRQAPPPVNPFLPTSTTVVPKAATGSTSPSTTIPAPTSNPFLNPKSTSPSSGKNFVGPTIDPSLMEARRALSDQQLEAIRSGVDPAVASDIAGGGKNPNRGFIGVGKGIGDLLKKAVPDVLDVTEQELVDWVDHLDNKILKKINDFFNNIPKLYHKIEYTNSFGNKKTVEFTSLRDFFTLG